MTVLPSDYHAAVAAFPTDYYASAAQVIPLLFVVAMVEMRFLSQFDRDLTRIERKLKRARNEAKRKDLALEHSGITWAFFAVMLGVLESLVAGEAAALAALAQQSATSAWQGLIICAFVTGATVLVWFPLRLPFRHMRAHPGKVTKATGRGGHLVLTAMLAIAAFGPAVYGLAVLIRYLISTA